ncbi:MAG: EscR/YscR/HrcR family type III secretion system export apparatus protein [Isosphaeraceae bacterium]
MNERSLLGTWIGRRPAARLGMLAAALMLGAGPPPRSADPAVRRTDLRSPAAQAARQIAPQTASPSTTPATSIPMPVPPSARAANANAHPGTKAAAAGSTAPVPANPLALNGPDVIRSVQTVGLFALVSFAPAAVLMVTAFVRINVVLVLLRQALGSPQVPGNQVLSALALLLTALVMRPVGETVYARAIEPYAAGKLDWKSAYREASTPIKQFMIEQIRETRHERYLFELYELAVPGAPVPVYEDEVPMRVVAPAFLLSELTTALVIGFYLYLPFLAVDLVVSAVLTAMGLFMLPPSLVALPLKLILFVLADGWLLVAAMLLRTFGLGAGP